MAHFYALCSLILGVASLLWMLFLIAQGVFPGLVHISTTVINRVCTPLAFLLPAAAIVLGLVALARIRASEVDATGFDRFAAVCGPLLGGLALLLCLVVALFLFSLP